MQKKVIILLLILVFLEVGISRVILFFQEKELQTKVAGAKTISLVGLTNPTFTPAPTPTLTPTLTPSPMVIPTSTPALIIVLPQDLDSLFTKYANEYSVNKELLKKIANCESNLNPSAKTNLYAGLFQFAEPIWIQTRNLMGQNPDINLRFSAEESVRTAAFMVSQGHLGIWPNCSK